MPKRTAPLVLRSVAVPTRTVPVAPSPPRPSLHRLVGVAGVVLLSLLAVLVTPAPAMADPGDEITFEGGTAEMREQLTETQDAWLDAKAALDASVARQQELEVVAAQVQDQIDEQTVELGKVAHVAYVSAGIVGGGGIISNVPTDDYLDGMSVVDALAQREANLIRSLLEARAVASQAQVAIAQEMATQQELLVEMENRKQQAQLALCQSVGGICPDSGGFTNRVSYVPTSAPRNANGTWPVESRTVYEPATGGRITPRLAHARDQAIAAGFDRYVACYRSYEDGGQHPRGRACDFAVRNDWSVPYGNASVSGDAQEYGNDLAAWFVFNADRLGVLYVIWYRQIWTASSGRWRSYSGCCDASSMHTNHVHLSVR